MSGTIFLSYRRGDEPGFALALYGRLEQSFAPEQLFMDVEGGIDAGDDFVKVLETQVAQCDVLLALIGQGWLGATNQNGGRRLENPDDFVRIEIVSAMRLGKRVIPVLINKTEMPRADDLPEPLKLLARRNAVRLTQERFRADVQGLITALEGALRQAEAAREAASTAAAEAKLKQQQDEAAKAEEAARAEKERIRLEAIAGLSPEQIAKAEELANWEFIKASTSGQDFRDHLARFSTGVTERFARTSLEELTWAGLGKAPTHSQISDFLTEFPHGKHAKQAADRCAALEKEQTAAREETERLRREMKAWAAASSANDVPSLATFLKEWPQSQHAKAARTRIDKLKGGWGRRRVVLGGAGGAVIAVGLAAGLQPRRPLWSLLYDQSIKTFEGHSDAVTSVAYSPDGRTVLSASADKTLKLWDVATGEQIRTFTAHSDVINAVAFSPNGLTALSGSSDKTVKLWEIETGKEVFTLRGHGTPVRSVGFSLDGNTALSGGDQEPMPTPEPTLEPETRVLRLRSPTVRLWDLTSKSTRRVFRVYGRVSSVSFSPNGRSGLVAQGNTFTSWDVASATQIRTFMGHSNAVNAVVFLPDGLTAVSGSSDTTVQQWNVDTGSLLTVGRHSDSVRSVAPSSDGRRVLSGSDDKTLKLWEVPSGLELRTFGGHLSAVSSVAFSPDGRTAVSGSADKTLKLWNLTGL